MSDTAFPEKPPVAESSSSDDTDKPTDAEAQGSFKDYVRVFSYADRTDWILNVIALITSIAAGATLPLMTIIFGQFITKFNDFVAGKTSPETFQDNVDHFILWFIYLFLARFALSYITTVSITVSATRTVRSLRQAFFLHTIRQEIWHFDKQTNGATAAQVTTNGNRINTGIAEKLTFAFQSLSMFFSSFIVALAIQWKLTLITMSIIPMIFIVTGLCIAVDAVQEARITKIYSQASSLAEEAFSSIRTIQAFWAYTNMSDQYNEFLKAAHKEGNKKSPNYAILFSTEYFCIYAGIALSFWQGFRMYQSGEISNPGTVFTVVLSVTIAGTSISTLAPQITAFTNASAAASELFRIIDKPSLLDPLAEGGAMPATCRGQIEVRNVNFAYPTRPNTLVAKDLSIDLPAGKTTALVGASGCGKSTLVGLLERWYLPKSGQILLDGMDVSEYNVKWLRSQIGLVQQEPVLFRGTVYANVTNGFSEEQRRTLSDDKKLELVQKACISANAHDFIESLPQGYFTEVGERAGMLSGGQRQRIAIARAIVSDPKVLLLDEATSALDPKAEKVVQDALNKVSVNRTTMIIAHKLATVKNADSIAVISAGHVVEQGTHEELIAADGHYARLVNAQHLGAEKEEEAAAEESNELQPVLSLKRSNSYAVEDTDGKPKTGTLGYGLWKCIAIMLAEQKSLYPLLALSGVACLIAGGTFPGQALLYSRLLRVFLLPAEEARSQANFYALMFFVLALGNLLAYAVIGWLCNVIGQVTTHRYRLEMFNTILRQDMDFFDLPENSSGALTSRCSTLPNQLQELISANILLIFIVLVNIVSSSVLALAYGWKLALVVIFGGLPPLLGAGYLRIRLETRMEGFSSERFSGSAALASEAVMAIRTVASLTMETLVLEQYNAMLDGIVLKSIKSTLWIMILFALSQSMDFLVMALGFWYGSTLLVSHEYTTTQFYIIFIGVLFAGQAAGQFFSYSTSLTNAAGAANYILWLRQLKPTMQENPSNKNSGPLNDDSNSGSLQTTALDFSYKQRASARVLRNLNLTIPSGAYVAFVGPSGCGKSTIISLLERFYDPTSGSISLNATDIRTFSPRLYRANISLVQQEPTLYQGSIRANIAIGLSSSAAEISDTALESACKAANAWDFISSLPQGLDTPCGQRGMQFSGGQRQRISIARALVRDPRLLLLDEATSALDTESERVVQGALDGAAMKKDGKGGGRTTVAVAHRLSTIRGAERIFVFSNGRVVEEGSHVELLARRGVYAEMCRAQSLDVA